MVIIARLHRWSFRMSGISEAMRLSLAMLGGSVLFLLIFRHTSPHGLPRTVYALEFFFTWSLMAGFRFAPRLADSWLSEQQRKRNATRTIIVGAGSAGDLLARDLIRRRDDAKYHVVGYVDD